MAWIIKYTINNFSRKSLSSCYFHMILEQKFSKKTSPSLQGFQTPLTPLRSLTRHWVESCTLRQTHSVPDTQWISCAVSQTHTHKNSVTHKFICLWHRHTMAFWESIYRANERSCIYKETVDPINSRHKMHIIMCGHHIINRYFGWPATLKLSLCTWNENGGIH